MNDSIISMKNENSRVFEIGKFDSAIIFRHGQHDLIVVAPEDIDSSENDDSKSKAKDYEINYLILQSLADALARQDTRIKTIFDDFIDKILKTK